ncbi:hypothetical protein JCM11251_001086 [Rhodosporidiobolus azoricus]
MDDIQTQLLELVSSLPVGANPYEVLRSYLWRIVVPDLPNSFRGQLLFHLVVLALCLILVLGSLANRLWRKSFWITHFGSSPKLIRPHFSVSWSLWAVILLILMCASIGETIHYYYVGRKIRRGFIAWKTLSWLPAWYGGFTAAWSIAVSYLLHLHTYGHVHSVERVAPLVNISAIAVPVAYSLIIVPFACLSAHHFALALDSFEQIDQLHASSAVAYNGGFNILDLVSGLPVLQKMQGDFQQFIRFFRITFALYATSGFLLVVLLASVALLYLFSLRNILTTANNLSRSTTSTRESRQKLMSRTYSNLVVTVIAFSLLGLIFSITCSLIAHDPAGLANATKTQVFHLLPFYAFCVFGLPCATLLFVRSFDQSSPLHRAHSSSNNTRGKSGTRPTGAGAGAAQVSVSVHVVSFAEDPLTPPARRACHSRRSSILPYAHARAAFDLPVPAGFEMVEVEEKEREREKYAFDDPSENGHDHDQDRRPQVMHAVPSPGFAPESPVVGRWFDAAETGSHLSSPSRAPRRPFSDMSLTDSLAAEKGSIASPFSFGATTRLDDSPVGSPVRTVSSALRPDSAVLWETR